MPQIGRVQELYYRKNIRLIEFIYDIRYYDEKRVIN